ncbi:hypothetical protein IL306_000062 [Fusarium sp. DS 682]|nr:hypothetical protein IL306_000062 [Fusarium sp. DS 682]
MDLLNRFPVELHLQLLSYFDIGTDMVPLMEAYPPVIPLYCDMRRSFYKKLFDNRMLQDALAIVSFPSLKELRADYGSAASHVNKWKKAQFLDPFEHDEYKTVNSLDKLYSRLSTFIEDFITKATAEYPCRAYMGLPDLSSTHGRLLFQGRPMEYQVLKLDNLNPDETRRLFRSFLQYELLCKFYRRDRGSIRVRSFDERISTAYGEFHDWELEALRSVYDYVRGLYGAICAQYLGSWVPDAPSVLFDNTNPDLSKRTGLKFPDNIYYNGDRYRSDLQEVVDPYQTALNISGKQRMPMSQRSFDKDIDEFAHLGFDPKALPPRESKT